MSGNEQRATCSLMKERDRLSGEECEQQHHGVGQLDRYQLFLIFCITKFIQIELSITCNVSVNLSPLLPASCFFFVHPHLFFHILRQQLEADTRQYTCDSSG